MTESLTVIAASCFQNCPIFLSTRIMIPERSELENKFELNGFCPVFLHVGPPET